MPLLSFSCETDSLGDLKGVCCPWLHSKSGNCLTERCRTAPKSGSKVTHRKARPSVAARMRKRWAQSTEAAIREGRYFKTQEARRHTVAEMIDRYVREVLPDKPRNARNIAFHLRWWKEQLGPRALADVTPAAIVECRDRLLSTPVPAGEERDQALAGDGEALPGFAFPRLFDRPAGLALGR